MRRTVWAMLASVSALAIMQPIQSVNAYDDGISPKPIQDDETGTTTFNRAYLDKFSNVTNALDLAQRIPGAQPMLMRNGGNQRGFATNNDPILINGKRLSGKSNNSHEALQRISADQVLRIEIIKGTSPDIKASSSVGFLNFVLKEEAKSGSFTYNGRVIRTRTGRAKVDGGLSYSNKVGKLDYVVGVTHGVDLTENIRQREEIFDANGMPTFLQLEDVSQNNSVTRVTSNLTYNFENGDLLNLNGLYQKQRFWLPTTGEGFAYDPVAGYQSVGFNARDFDNGAPSWEFGGDYSTDLGEKWSMKIIGLYSTEHRKFDQSEDFNVDPAEPLPDFVFNFDREASEKIVRPSFSYKINDKMELEFGDELAFNKVTTKLGLSTLQGGALVPQDLSGNDVTVKETRSETFVNYTWKISPKWNLESSVTYENSKISQHAVGGVVSKTFEYVKPSVDLRFQLNTRNQLQFSLRKNVAQLNFSDFASSVSGDDDIISANPDLKPDVGWRYEVSWDHRFKNDVGNIKLTYFKNHVSDVIQQVEVAPGVSGVGNFGSGRFARLNINSTIKFGFIGAPNLKWDVDFNRNWRHVTNPFTGLKDTWNGTRDYFGRSALRNDFDDLGLAIGFDIFIMGPGDFYDYDERTEFDVGHMSFLASFAEYKLNKSMTLTLRYENLYDRPQKRIRNIYAGGIASDIITETQVREQRFGQRLLVGLKGTF